MKAGKVISTHHSAALERHNYRESVEAAKATGLFVRVKDVDRPVWQVRIDQQDAQDRWAEILAQTFAT